MTRWKNPHSRKKNFIQYGYFSSIASPQVAILPCAIFFLLISYFSRAVPFTVPCLASIPTNNAVVRPRLDGPRREKKVASFRFPQHLAAAWFAALAKKTITMHGAGNE